MRGPEGGTIVAHDVSPWLGHYRVVRRFSAAIRRLLFT